MASLDPHDSLTRSELLCLFQRYGNWGSEKGWGMSLPGVLELVAGLKASGHISCLLLQTMLLPWSVSWAKRNNEPQRGKVAIPRSQSPWKAGVELDCRASARTARPPGLVHPPHACPGKNGESWRHGDLCFSKQPLEGEAGSFPVQGIKGINSWLRKGLLSKAAILFLALNPSMDWWQGRQLLAAWY